MANPSRDRKEAIANPSRDRKGAIAITANNLPHNPSPEPISGVDGLVTDEPNVPLMVLSADCCLMVLYDPARPAVGVAHVG
ncbi:MAG: laccase domain-containing protein, partial [Planctomycetes bacterium]|nr:laccase domain-containing protein [Planctomycetota bacterium]